MSTLDKVVEILAEAKDLEADRITEASTWEELGLDSLDTVELVMNMEDAFGISLEMTEDMKSVGDVVKAIRCCRAVWPGLLTPSWQQRYPMPAVWGLFLQ